MRLQLTLMTLALAFLGCGGGGTSSQPAPSNAGATSAAPTAPSILAPATVTANDTSLLATLTAEAGTTYTWSIQGGTLTSAADGSSVTFDAGAPGTLTLSVLASNTKGTVQSLKRVNVSPRVPTITAPAQVNAGQSGYLASVPTQSECTYAWSVTNGTLTAGQGTTQITFTAGTSGNVQLACTVANTAGSKQSTLSIPILASVQAPTTPTITAPAQVTAGQSGYLAGVAAQSGCTYTWSASNGTLTAGQGTTQITFTAGASGSVQLACTIANAAGSSQGTLAVSIVAPVLPPATPVITAPSSVAAGATGLQASVSTQSGVTFAWTLQDGTFTSSPSGSLVTFTAGAAGTLTLTCVATNSQGTAQGMKQITVNPNAPTQPVVAAPAQVVSNQAGYAASVTAQPGCTYAWTITNGTLTGGQGSNQITFTAGASGTLQLTCTVANSIASAQALASIPIVTDSGKKILELGWDIQSPQGYVASHATLEQSPFDGAMIALAAGRVVFQHATYSSTALATDQQYLPQVNTAKLTDNFLLMRGEAESTWDPFSDTDWALAESNIRTFAQMAKLGNLKGIAFDPETYSGYKSLWYYPAYGSTHTFAECQAKMRQRGAQFITALQQEYPGCKLFSFGWMSFLKLLLEDAHKDATLFASQLPTHPYGLLPSFLNGILDALPPGVEVVDGGEITYNYYHYTWYDYVKGVIRNYALPLIDTANQTKYGAQVGIGMATYLDGSFQLLNAPNLLSYYLAPADRPNFFEYQVYHNLRAADHYAWVYSEHVNWYTRSGIPTGAENAIADAKARIIAGQALPFDLEATISAAETRMTAAGY